MKITWKDILFFLIPGVLGYSIQVLCPLRKAGKDVKFRPPAVAFGIIWAILFILFGLSWVIAVRESSHEIIPIITYSVATITLAAWIYVYGCANSSKGASWVLIFAVAAVLCCFTQGNQFSKMMVCPLLAWAIFAMMMNTTEVQID
jgi:tryptophan-rich sensory protein